MQKLKCGYSVRIRKQAHLQRLWNLGCLPRKHDKINLTLSIYILQVKKLSLRDGKQMQVSTRAESKTQVSGLPGKHQF